MAFDIGKISKARVERLEERHTVKYIECHGGKKRGMLYRKVLRFLKDSEMFLLDFKNLTPKNIGAIQRGQETRPSQIV